MKWHHVIMVVVVLGAVVGLNLLAARTLITVEKKICASVEGKLSGGGCRYALSLPAYYP